MKNSKTYEKELIEAVEQKSDKNNVNKWGKGAIKSAIVALTIAGVVLSSSVGLVKSFKAERLTEILASGLREAAQTYHVNEGGEENYYHGYSDIGLDEAAKEMLIMSEYGQVDPDVVVAAHFNEAGYAKGYEDELPTMNDLFRRIHNLIAGHEEEYSPEVVEIYKHGSFEEYCEANGVKLKDYPEIARKVLIIAATHGCDSEEVHKYLEKKGFTNDSGGRI